MRCPHKCQLYRDLGTANPSLGSNPSFKSCTEQRAAEYLDLLSSRPGGNVSTFTPDTCTAGTGGSLQKLTLGQHMLQEDAL